MGNPYVETFGQKDSLQTSNLNLPSGGAQGWLTNQHRKPLTLNALDLLEGSPPPYNTMSSRIVDEDGGERRNALTMLPHATTTGVTIPTSTLRPTATVDQTSPIP